MFVYIFYVLTIILCVYAFTVFNTCVSFSNVEAACFAIATMYFVKTFLTHWPFNKNSGVIKPCVFIIFSLSLDPWGTYNNYSVVSASALLRFHIQWSIHSSQLCSHFAVFNQLLTITWMSSVQMSGINASSLLLRAYCVWVVVLEYLRTHRHARTHKHAHARTQTAIATSFATNLFFHVIIRGLLQIWFHNWFQHRHAAWVWVYVWR